MNARSGHATLQWRAVRGDAPAGCPAEDSVVDSSCWDEALDHLRQRPDEALALELSLPFCVWQCLYCDREIEPGMDLDSMAAYVDLLVMQLERTVRTLATRHDVLMVHLGGGSPNHLALEQIERLVEAVRAAFRTPAEAEWSIGCDPRRCSATQMERLHRLGFRQIRFGQADLDPTVQAAAGRLQSVAMMADVMALARAARFERLQLELVCGLPGQTDAGWMATLEALMALAPDRIRCLPFRRPPPWMRSRMSPAPLPAPEACERLWRVAADRLTEAGYRWIGADLFVLDDDPLARAQDRDELHHLGLGHSPVPVRHHLAFGPGRLSDVADTRAWTLGARDRWAAALRQGQWPLAAVQPRSAVERQRRRAAEALRCQGFVPSAWLDEGLRHRLRALGRDEADEWLVSGVDGLRVSPAGRYHLEALCALVEAPDPAAEGTPCST